MRQILRVYVVVWGRDGIVKAVWTTRKRWKLFVSRGARLAYLVTKVPDSTILATTIDLIVDQAIADVNPRSVRRQGKSRTVSRYAWRGVDGVLQNRPSNA